ncbi:MAG: hypothetical protein WBL53_03435 [Pseudonocardiaceae bacterium]
MHIAWGSLGIVFVVSFGAAVAVVVLVAFALVALSARAANPDDPPAIMGVGAGTALAGVCLTAAAAIVLYGLYIIIAA